MSDDELRGWLRNVGGSTPQFLDDDAVWRKFAPVFRDPGERPLDNPAAGQDDEPDGVLRTADGLERQVQVLLRTGHELSGIAGVGPDNGDFGVHQPLSEQDFLRRFLPSLHTLAAGVTRDLDAVISGLTLAWNSGVVEGHLNRIKIEQERPPPRRTSRCPHGHG